MASLRLRRFFVVERELDRDEEELDRDEEELERDNLDLEPFVRLLENRDRDDRAVYFLGECRIGYMLERFG